MKILLCCGENGRAVVFGEVDQDPVPGQPVELRNARMILYWAGPKGLFGVAAEGPGEGSKLTCAVERVVETRWQEYLVCSDQAARLMDGWK